MTLSPDDRDAIQDLSDNLRKAVSIEIAVVSLLEMAYEHPATLGAGLIELANGRAVIMRRSTVDIVWGGDAMARKFDPTAPDIATAVSKMKGKP